jgi:hypothetical protein
MVAALKAFVEDGGKLLLSGAGALARFGEDFLGVEAGAALDAGSYHVPAGDGSAPVYSERWQLLSPLATEGIGRLGKSSLLDDRLLPGPAWAHHQIGAGAVATVPFDLFRSFDRNRYPRVRQFVSEVVARLAGPLPTRVETPTAVDVILRRKGDMTLVHLLNRSSGLPNVPTSGGVDEIMPLGPIVIEIDRETTPASVSLAFEEGEIEWLHADGVLRVMVKQVRIHAAVVVVEP